MTDSPGRAADGRTSAPAPDAAPKPGPTPGFELIESALKTASSGPVNLEPGALLNMELSNLAFQARVLELAADPSVPLLERVRFVSIFGTNMDEFFRTRVAGFKRQVALGSKKRTLDGMRPDEQLEVIRKRTHHLNALVYDDILPAIRSELSEHGIELLRWDDLPDSDRRSVRWQYGPYLDTLLTPLTVHPDRPFPHVRNLRPALAVQLRDGDDSHLAILALPGDAPALVPLAGGRRFVSLEDVLRMDLPRLFSEYEVLGAHLFRVTRSGNLTMQPDEPENVVEVVSENVALRPFSPVVRLEVEQGMPQEVEEALLAEFTAEAEGRASHFGAEDVYRVGGLIDLKRLEKIAALPIRSLRYPSIRRKTPLPRRMSVFERIRKRSVLVRFPQHSFEGTVERFIREAATDPAVEEIRVTLYRTNRSSSIVRLLRKAFRNDKRVVAFIEVKASFDERRNIEWARSLEAEGIQVLYGPPSLKVHSKIAVVQRREPDGLRIYSYIGTGNLNAATAAGYTDVGLFTADQEIGAELLDIFEGLADSEASGEYRHLIVAPFNMRSRFLELIGRETQHARAGRGGRITAKLNGLADRQLIAALYDAANAGVEIDLAVRGICSLRPGVPGLSENIRIVGNAGRYLEHSRIFRFDNAGDPDYFIGSADWRGRNLSRRVEVVTPVRLRQHRTKLDELLTESLEDPRGWELRPDGSYERRSGTDTPPSRASA